MRHACFIPCALLVILAMNAGAAAADLHVPSDFRTIQAAIDAADLAFLLGSWGGCE